MKTYRNSKAKLFTQTIVLCGMFVLCFSFVTHKAGAATFTSTQTGNWQDCNTWGTCPGTVEGTDWPGSADTAVITSTHNVTVTVNQSASAVQFNSASTAGTLTINNGITLTISGAITLFGLTTGNTAATLTGSGTGTISAGSITVGQDLAYTGTRTIIMTSTVPILTISGSLNLLSYRGVNSSRTGNATFNLQSGVVSISTSITSTNETSDNTSTFSMASGAQSGTLNLSGATPWSLSGTGANTTTLNGTTAVVNYNSSSAQTVQGTTYTTLKINNTNVSGATLGAATTTTTLTIGDTSSAILSDGGFQLTSTGTLNLTAGTFKLGSAGTGTTYPAFATNNISSGTTVEYASNQSQTIAAVNYSNLTSSGSGARTLASSGTIGISGTFTPGSNTYTVTGSTVNFNGTGAQTIPASNYNNLTISAARTTNSVTLASSGTIGVAGTLSLTATFTSGVYVITGSTIDFNGTGAQTVPAFNYNNITISGARTTNSVTLASSGTIGIAATFSLTATFTSGGYVVTGSTVQFNGSSNQTINAGFTFNNLEIKPVSNSVVDTFASGTVTVNGAFTVGNGTNSVNATAATNNPTLVLKGDVTLNNVGTLTAGSQNITVGTDGTTDGDFVIESGGVFAKGSGTLILDGGSDGSPTIFNDKNSTKQDMGAVQIGQSPATTNLSSNLSGTSLTVATGDKLNTRGYDITMTTFITVNGTLNGTDTVAGDGTVISLGTDWTVAAGGTFTAEESDVKPTTVIFNQGTSGNLTPGGTDESHDFYTLQITKSSSATVTLQGAIDVENDLAISNSNSTLDTKSGSNYAIALAGSWTNSGTFTPQNGTVTFDSTDTGETIDAGGTGAGKPFYDVVFNNGSGGWTIQTNDMKVSHNLTITDVSSWALASNRTLEVDGTYSIVDAETSATTWNTGSIFFMNGTSQTIGSKTQNAESYDKLQVGDNTHIRMWNSNAVNATTPYTVSASGSLYSQDHGNTNGDLYIWGNYAVPDSATDYWNYEKDFNGDDISGTPRTANVRIDPSAKVTVGSGETLKIVGTSGNRTTVSRQGVSSGYELVCDAGTIDIQYADFDYLDGPAGLDIRASSTVTNIANSTFENLVGTGGTDANITVVTSVIGSGTKTLSGNSFTLGAGDKNAAVTGTDVTGYWTFSGINGESDDWNNTTNANEADPGMLRWDDSVLNQNPNVPASLTQKNGSGVAIVESAWTTTNTPKLGFTVTDPDTGDTVKYRIQVATDSGFSSLVLDYTHGSLSASGTVFTFVIGTYGDGTCTGTCPATLSDSATGYWWRVKAIDNSAAESAFVEFGVASTMDFKVDATAPTGGSVYDGTSGDQDWNNGSLTQISGNWTDFNTDVSGLSKYEYAIRREPDDFYWSVCSGAGVWQAGANWCDNTTSTSYTQNTLNLSTGVTYYVSVRTTDNAGNVETVVDSNGQQVLPLLSFSLSGNTVAFNNLNAGNNYTDTKTITTTTSTNASNGYTIKIYNTDSLRSTGVPGTTIPDFSGTWSSPASWGGGQYGFGYTSSDTSVQGSNRFSGGTAFAAFTQTPPGDVVADHTDTVNGTTGAIANQQFTITYKVAASTSQAALYYQTTSIFIVTANY